MIQFFIHNTTGLVLRTGHCQIGCLMQQAAAGEHVRQGAAQPGDLFDVASMRLSTPTAPTAPRDRWVSVRQQRDGLLSMAGQTLADVMLPDSFPKMTTARRQAQIDAVVAYRQALRDITNQPDPAAIVWPTPPGAI